MNILKYFIREMKKLYYNKGKDLVAEIINSILKDEKELVISKEFPKEKLFSILVKNSNEIIPLFIKRIETKDNAIMVYSNITKNIKESFINIDQWKLNEIYKFNSIYTVKLFLSLDINETEFSIEELRKILLDNVEQYQRFSEFRRNCLEKAVNEINQKTNYKIRYEFSIQLKKIKEIKFTLRRDDNEK